MEKSAEQGNGEKGQSATESVKRLLKSRQKKRRRRGTCVWKGEKGISLQVTRGPYHGTWQAGSQTAPEADPSRGKVQALSVPTQRRNACCFLRSQRLK